MDAAAPSAEHEDPLAPTQRHRSRRSRSSPMIAGGTSSANPEVARRQSIMSQSDASRASSAASRRAAVLLKIRMIPRVATRRKSLPT